MDDAGAPLRENDVVGGHTIIGHLGSGGMGTVYLVAHPRLPRRQALKVLSSSLGANPEFRERFRREDRFSELCCSLARRWHALSYRVNGRLGGDRPEIKFA